MLGVATADRWAARLLRDTYAPLRCAAAEAQQCVFIPAHDTFAHASHAVRDTFATFAAQDQSRVAFYGASVALGDRGALIFGRSGIGKTVLALNLAYRGARFLGDETALVDPGARTICALPRRPSLREPGLAYLLDKTLAARVASCPRAYRTSRGRLWYAIDHSLLGLIPDVLEYPLRAIFVLTERVCDPSIADLPLYALLPAVARRINGGGTDLTRLATLHAILRGVRAYRVRIGSPATTAEMVLRGIECA